MAGYTSIGATPLKIRNTSLSDFNEVSLDPFQHSIDERGSFYKIVDLTRVEIQTSYNQLKSFAVSTTKKMGSIRGIHFQTEPFAEKKIVACLQGKSFHVVVDLRDHSKTLGQWFSVVLDENLPLALHLPVGVAHGFQTLEHSTKIFYAISANYSAENAFSINPFDLKLAINWPLAVSNISDRDKSGITIAEAISLNG